MMVNMRDDRFATGPLVAIHTASFLIRAALPWQRARDVAAAAPVVDGLVRAAPLAIGLWAGLVLLIRQCI